MSLLTPLVPNGRIILEENFKTTSMEPTPNLSSAPSANPARSYIPTKPPVKVIHPTFTNLPSHAPSSIIDGGRCTNGGSTISTVNLTLIPNRTCSQPATSATLCSGYNYQPTSLVWNVEKVNKNTPSFLIYGSSTPEEISDLTKESYCLDSTQCYKLSIAATSAADANAYPASYSVYIDNQLDIEEQTIEIHGTTEHYIGAFCDDYVKSSIPTLSPVQSQLSDPVSWNDVAVPVFVSLLVLVVIIGHFHKICTRRSGIDSRNENLSSHGNRNSRRRRRSRRRNGMSRRSRFHHDHDHNVNDDNDNVRDIFADIMNEVNQDQYAMDERQIRRMIVLKNIIYKRVEKKYDSEGLHELDNSTNTNKSLQMNKSPFKTFTTAAAIDDDELEEGKDEEDLSNYQDNDSSVWIGDDDNDDDDFDDISLDETTISNSIVNNSISRPAPAPAPAPATATTSTREEEKGNFEDIDVFNDNLSTRSLSLSSIFHKKERTFKTRLVDMFHNSESSSRKLHQQQQLHQQQSSSTLNSTASTMSALKSCPICMEVFLVGDEVGFSRNKECNHCFHVDCIIHWLMENDECPICRRDYLYIA